VDHDAKRREIIEATWRVIDAGGLAGTTIREIAREAGCSSGVLSHYFADREDILASAMMMAHRGVRDRTDRQAEHLNGLTALRILMLESLPLDEQRVLEARIEACFWGAAVGNEKLMRLQNSEVEGWCDRVRSRLLEAGQAGELRVGVDIDDVVDRLLALMDGFSIQAVLNPKRTPPDRQVRHLDDLFAGIRCAGGIPAQSGTVHLSERVLATPGPPP
jgi:AcrR family transcriptional regulator